MADVKFTPGPWEEDGIMIVGANGEGVCFMHEPAQHPGDVSTPAGPNTKANAHLIAASLDLYEALKALTEAYGAIHVSHDIDPEDSPRYVAARAALAKAEGQS